MQRDSNMALCKDCGKIFKKLNGETRVRFCQDCFNKRMEKRNESVRLGNKKPNRFIPLRYRLTKLEKVGVYIYE